MLHYVFCINCDRIVGANRLIPLRIAEFYRISTFDFSVVKTIFSETYKIVVNQGMAFKKVAH